MKIGKGCNCIPIYNLTSIYYLPILMFFFDVLMFLVIFPPTPHANADFANKIKL